MTDWEKRCADAEDERDLLRGELARGYDVLVGLVEALGILTHTLADPPAPWQPFGAHADAPDVPLVFWGLNADGLPIWEREA